MFCYQSIGTTACIDSPEPYTPQQKDCRTSITHKCMYIAILHLCPEKETVKLKEHWKRIKHWEIGIL